MNLRDFLGRLDCARKSGDQYEARCPAHDDKRASLRITERDGKVLLTCRAGCETRAVVGALGLSMGDLRTVVDERRRGKARVVTSYDYRDEVGALLYQVVRQEPKDFRQRRPDGKGGWEWKLNGVRRVLYRLPELLAADPEATVYVAEGEKDCDALARLGLVATCNAGGADEGSGSKWLPDFASHLQGRRVVLLEDNDAAGRRHVAHVGQTLRGKAASVKLVRFTSLPEHGDVSDWLGAGGTVEELRQLADAAPEWDGSPVEDETSESVEPFPVVLAARVEAKPLEYLVQGHIPVNAVGFMSGQPGVSKSYLTAEIAIGVASGTEIVGGFATRAGTVLLFNAEDDAAVISRPRLEGLARSRGLDLQNLPVYFIDTPKLRLDLEEDVSRLEVTVRAAGAALVVLDPLRNLHWRNEDSSTEMTPVLDGLRAIQKRTGASILLVTHDRKSKGEDGRRESMTRGTSAIQGWRDYAIYLDQAKGGAVTVRTYGKGCEQLPPWSYSITKLDGAVQLIATREQDMGLAAEAEHVLRGSPEGLTREELRHALGKARFGVHRVIEGLLRRGVAVESPAMRTRSNGRALAVKVLRPAEGNANA